MTSINLKKSSGKTSSSLIVALATVVVAVIIFAAPVSEAITTARKAAATLNLGQIAKTYDAFVHATTPPRLLAAQPGDTAHAVAVLLARVGQLNDAIVWFVPTDPKLNGNSIPATIVSGAAGSTSINPDFARLTLSYVFVANINPAPLPPTPAPNAMTPVAWTRGLRDDGTWAPDSPWQGQGGHIAFLDGHVVWYNRLNTQQDVDTLYKYGTNIPTTNIKEALPPGAIILNAEPSGVSP